MVHAVGDEIAINLSNNNNFVLFLFYRLHLMAKRMFLMAESDKDRSLLWWKHDEQQSLDSDTKFMDSRLKLLELIE